MSRYLVKVETLVVVEARNVMDAKAKGETAVRTVVSQEYTYEEWSQTHEKPPMFADGWERFRFQAKKAERLSDDD